MPNFQAQGSLPTVLLIDDDLVSREVAATVLIMNGYTVHTAPSGTEALELLAGGECVPGVILMDAQMPGLSGTRLIEELRARSHARVVAISGSHAPDEVAAAADGFLLKPFGADALSKLLEEDAAQAGHAVKASPSDPPALDPAEPVVHAETLARLRELMPEAAVREIYAAIVADLHQRLAALELAIADGDAAGVRRIGHAIKGGCGMAGARQAARLGALLESGALESAQFEPGAPGNQGPQEAIFASWSGGDGSSPPGWNSNHLDNNSPVLRDLRAATRNLERMLETEFAL
ncbi:MAG: response regulator [Terracidiphilus sp.]|jgi:CheY-like chemotaxis protein